MTAYKRGGKWCYEFTVRGERVRGSSGSSDRDIALLLESEHRRSVELETGVQSPSLQALKAKAKESDQIASAFSAPTSEAEERKPERTFVATAALMPGMTLKEAGDLWLHKQAASYRKRTLESNKGYLNSLLKFFGNIPLSEFHIGHFEHYQSGRGKDASPSTVNHELNTLSRILKEVDLWYPIKRQYRTLKERGWKPPKIFTADEQERLFRKLQDNPNLELGEIAFTITRNTTASGCELRGLRLRNVELEADPPRVHIPPEATKNNIRPRTIPLNAEAVAAFSRALARAKRLGCHYPEHYLFPLRVNRALYDPTRPASASWLRKQTEELRKLTGIEHITPHTFRHLAVTELLEKGAPEETVIALAGWVGRKMIATYSHSRIGAKADVVNLLDQSGHKAPEPPLKAPTTTQFSPDLTHRAIQVEIARQVALALRGLAPRSRMLRRNRTRFIVRHRQT